MTVELSSNKNREPERDQDGLCQPSAAELLVRNVVKSCKAMSSYEAASSLLLEMIEVASKDAAALAMMTRDRHLPRGLSILKKSLGDILFSVFFQYLCSPKRNNRFWGCY